MNIEYFLDGNIPVSTQHPTLNPDEVCEEISAAVSE